MEFYLWRKPNDCHILEHHIDLRLETNLVEIISDEKDMPKQSSPIKARLIAKLLAWQPVFPNVNFLKDSGIELEKESK
jgi:hypothetical protein